MKIANRIVFILCLAFTSLLIGCAHQGKVSSSMPTNIYADSDKKLAGNFVYQVDKTSLSKLKKDDTVSGYLCRAHFFPVDGGPAFENSLPAMLSTVFENIQPANSGTSEKDKILLLFRVERFEPKLKFSSKFFGSEAQATVELSVAVAGTKNGSRIFGTQADTQRSTDGDGGPFCSNGGEVIAEGTSNAIKDVLEKLGERMANSGSLKEAAKASANAKK